LNGRIRISASRDQNPGTNSSMVKEGYRFSLPPLILGVIALALRWHWVGGILIFLGFFVMYFFRNPNRTIPTAPGLVVSPADGHVLEVVEELLDGTMGRRITIFLAIWDVHVQRSPVTGRVADVVYRPGRFYAAMRQAASRENEQNIIYIHATGGRIVFKQIAGAIARRVICWKTEGQEVARGELMGLIRFGSRVDVWLPLESQVLVKRGQKVKGGESVLAQWNSTD
jgi:phosphatidylserine decarboxylase